MDLFVYTTISTTCSDERLICKYGKYSSSNFVPQLHRILPE